jgi:SsrA-binding protein
MVPVPMAKSGSTAAPRAIALNKRAQHRLEVLDKFEAGIVLVGTEVKTLRDGKVSLDEAYARVDGEELFLVGAYIQEYAHGNRANHDPVRKRKLLMRRREIRKLKARVMQERLTLVPLKLYWSARNLAKVELGLCRGRKLGDKRQVERKKEAVREMRNG